MARALLIVLDSVGCGGAPDAAAYGDAGADTLGHIAEACAASRADRAGLRAGPLRLPHLNALGLGSACAAATARMPPGLTQADPDASWGCAAEASNGKDTPSGHWELAGTPVPFAWGTFPRQVPCFPAALTETLVAEADLPGILGNLHASGPEVIAAFGAEHLRTAKPICYTSVDSVLQIAAHEDAFGLERLYAVCGVARRLCDPLKIGRVIARPFVGATRATFQRTMGRRDFAMPPPPGTLLERAAEAGRALVSVGKIADIFAHRFTGKSRKGATDDANLDLALDAFRALPAGGLVFANLVDFDTNYGHRRDVAGYAACLEAFDRRVPAVLGALAPDDLLVITADHGNDPTWNGTDHTRERVPVLARCAAHGPMRIGSRPSFADVGATIAQHLALAPPASGTSWLS